MPWRERDLAVRRALAGCGMVVLLGLGWWVWRPDTTTSSMNDRQSALGGADRAQAATISPLVPETQAAAPRRRQTHGAATLAQSFNALVAAAKAGDREALNELAQGLQRCQMLASSQQVLGLHERMLDADGSVGRQLRATPGAKRSGGIIDTLGRTVPLLTTNVQEEGRYCAGMRADQLATTGQWLLRSAKAGNAEAAFAFAKGEFLQHDPFAQLEWVRQWRDQAPAMLEQAFGAGIAGAGEALAMSYDPNVKTGPRQSQADPVRALAYYQASLLAGRCLLGCESRIARLEGSMSADAIAQADAQAVSICLSLSGRCAPGSKR